MRDEAAAAEAVEQHLDKLDIKYDEIEHPAVFTVEEANAVQQQLNGIGCKSILLTTKAKDRFILVLLQEDKRADTKAIARQVNSSHLSFASAELLAELLDLYPGAVSPFGIINDTDNKVELLIDPDLVGQRVLFHPNTNTRTVALAYDDLIKFIDDCHHKHQLLELPA